MPELPFLEVLAENLTARIEGRRIDSIAVFQPALLQTATLTPDRLRGERIARARRIGKLLALETESGRAIVFHLMRLGRLAFVSEPRPGKTPRRAGAAAPRASSTRPPLPPRNVSARVRLEDGAEIRLIEHGSEKRARLWLLEELDAIAGIAPTGLDPARGELTLERLQSALGAGSRELKPLLTDPRVIAGIGNGLADEILYEARLSPFKRTGAVSDEEAGRLHRAVLGVVRDQLERLRASAAGDLPQREPREHYAVHDHAGQPCARCHTPVARVSFADRETFYCPGCQTGGKMLKDRRLSRLLK